MFMKTSSENMKTVDQGICGL